MIPLMMLALDAKRRLTLPASLLPAQPGDHFQEFDPEEDAVVFRRSLTCGRIWNTNCRRYTNCRKQPMLCQLTLIKSNHVSAKIR